MSDLARRKESGLHQILILGSRREREGRVYNARPNSIGAYLTLLDWFDRWETLRLRRLFRGKFVPASHDEDGIQLYGPAGQRWLDQEERLKELRPALLETVRHLGVSPLEMSRFLTDCEDAIWERLARLIPKEEEEAWNDLEVRAIDFHRSFEWPLRELQSLGSLPAAQQWSHPDTVQNWARKYRLHRNTMSKYLRTQKIPNQRSGQFYRVSVDSLPADGKPSR